MIREKWHWNKHIREVKLVLTRRMLEDILSKLPQPRNRLHEVKARVFIREAIQEKLERTP